jgi:thioredoxin reductase (NADPH)
MAKPILLAVDDDPEVLRAVEHDLRRHYAERHRVLRADSGAAAVAALRALKKRNDTVALMLVDQRMPQMTGVEFLSRAMELYPEARRVLLTAYADTEAAIQAINQAKIHHYLRKPWDPPEEQLYPVLDDLLEDWEAAFQPPFEGITVLGHRWSARSHELRDFLARSQVPYRWVDLEIGGNETQLQQLAGTVLDVSNLPLVLFPEGEPLSNPTLAEIAAKVGLRTRAGTAFYDLLIVGGGPAGLAAGVYGASEGLTTVMIEREAPGGQAGMSSRIENYLGFPSGLSGGDLARRAVAQARRFGVEILSPQEAVRLCVDNGSKMVSLADGTDIGCKAMVIATGVSYRKLDVPGMDRLQGAGVYYGAAMTEGDSYRGEDIFVVGGANSAGQAAIYFSRFARQVVMLVRGGSLSATMSKYLIDQLQATANVRVETRTQVVEVHGAEHLEGISVLCGDSGETHQMPATSLFVFIGAAPKTDWLAGAVERDDRGFIFSGADLAREGKHPKGWKLERDPWLLETSVPGIFVAGDVRHGSVKRVASGVGEGAIAVQFIHQYLSTT